MTKLPSAPGGVEVVDGEIVKTNGRPVEEKDSIDDFGAMVKPAVICGIIATCVVLVTYVSDVDQFTPGMETSLRALIGNANLFSNALGSYAFDRGRNKRLRGFVNTQLFTFLVAQIIVAGIDHAGRNGIIPYDPHKKEGAISATLSANFDNWVAYGRDLWKCVQEHGLKKGLNAWLQTPYVIGGLMGTVMFGPLDLIIREMNGGISSAWGITLEAAAAGGAEPFCGAAGQLAASTLAKKSASKGL